MILGQAFFGHRLTLVAGPATALLLGILGSRTTPDAVYTAAAVCGALLAILSAAGLFGALRGFFTRRVTAAVVLLIAFTMIPTIVRLLTEGGRRHACRRAFPSPSPTSWRSSWPTGSFRRAGRSFLIVAGMAAGAAGVLRDFRVRGAPPKPSAGRRPCALVFLRRHEAGLRRRDDRIVPFLLTSPSP